MSDLDLDLEGEFFDLSKLKSMGKGLLNKAKSGASSLWNAGKRLVTPAQKKKATPAQKKKAVQTAAKVQ